MHYFFRFFIVYFKLENFKHPSAQILLKEKLMTDITLSWHNWGRLTLRTISPSQFLSIQKRELNYPVYEPSATEQSEISRIVNLLWISEYEYARKLFEQMRYTPRGESLEEFLFRLVVLVRDSSWGGWYERYPEYDYVRYGFLNEHEAYKASSTPLSELLKMSDPHFSSIDGLVNVGFKDNFITDKRFDKSELERVAGIIPAEYHAQIRLPLVFLNPATGNFQGKYKLIGSKLEEFLVQTLLKQTKVTLEKFKETPYVKTFDSITTLRRRGFNKIYKVFYNFQGNELSSDSSSVWLNARHDPYWPKSVQAQLSDSF
jgi:uncharacterized protein (UPF0216 family)